MEAKKVNIFAFIMMIAMCVFTIALSLKNNVKNGIDGDNGLSAYEIACEKGFSGTEAEWLTSLKGEKGENALANVEARDIYESYLDVVGKTEAEYSYQEFLVYYYSVIETYDSKTASQIAFSSTVDICYTYSEYTYYVASGYLTSGNEGEEDIPAYRLYPENNKEAKGLSAGAGVIYDMFDSNTDGKLDTAYIITNYHVAYIDIYCNDDNYVLYYDENTGAYFFATKYADEDVKETQDTSNPFNPVDCEYFLKEDITIPTNEEIIGTHFLTGENDLYYGIYLYGYQTAESRLNATFVGGSADNDIAVLKIERENLSNELAALFFDSNYYVPASIGDSSTIVGGEDVIAVGNPLIPDTSGAQTIEQAEEVYIKALCMSTTNGVVSIVSEENTLVSIIDSSEIVKMRLMRVSAAINSGNSGGGLFDLYGNLIGIVNSKKASSNYDNIGYAIPINTAVAIAEQVIKQCEGTNPASENTRISILTTKNLGFAVENGKSKSKLVIDANGNKEWLVSYNVVAKNVETTGYAYNAGLRSDDIITSIEFGGREYVADTYFLMFYDFERLLMNVSLNELAVKLNVSRVVSGSLETKEITINLVAGAFGELV